MKIYSLPDLPISYDALEPYIDTETMHLHHDKHHKTYVDKLNEAIESNNIKDNDIFKAMASDIRAVKNNAGGHYNHSLNWLLCQRPGSGSSGPHGILKEKIEQDFGSLDELRRIFNDAAASRFGSGYAWLGYNPKSKKLDVVSTANQDNPLIKGDSNAVIYPFLLIDVWEHAYYLKYHNRRVDYINQFWNVVNWDNVVKFYEEYASKELPVPLF